MMPDGVTICRNFLHLDIPTPPDLAGEVARIKAAAAEIAANLAARVKGPMIALRAHRLDDKGAETQDVFTVNGVRAALGENRRIVLEAPAGRGKTTTLVQLASDVQTGLIPIFVTFPDGSLRDGQSWSSSQGRRSFRRAGSTRPCSPAPREPSKCGSS